MGCHWTALGLYYPRSKCNTNASVPSSDCLWPFRESLCCGVKTSRVSGCEARTGQWLLIVKLSGVPSALRHSNFSDWIVASHCEMHNEKKMCKVLSSKPSWGSVQIAIQLWWSLNTNTKAEGPDVYLHQLATMWQEPLKRIKEYDVCLPEQSGRKQPWV